jgi:hypothetical protein
MRTDNNESAAESLAQMQAQTTAAQNSAIAAQSAAVTARRSLDANVQSFRIDSRAWIELDPIPHTLDMHVANGPNVFKYEIYTRNIGKTVAHDVEIGGGGDRSNPWRSEWRSGDRRCCRHCASAGDARSSG